jgi:hypothetical protein
MDFLSSSRIGGSLYKVSHLSDYSNIFEQTDVLEINSDRTLLSLSTRLPVREYCWYSLSSSHQGALDAKK